MVLYLLKEGKVFLLVFKGLFITFVNVYFCNALVDIILYLNYLYLY